MPPSGFFSRNLAIGEFSPSGCNSSIFVFAASTNTTRHAVLRQGQPARRRSRPGSRDRAGSPSSRSGVASATWFNRPIIASLRSRRRAHARSGFLPQSRIDGIAHGALDSAGDEIGVAALAARQALERLEDRRIDRSRRTRRRRACAAAGRRSARRDRRRDRPWRRAPARSRRCPRTESRRRSPTHSAPLGSRMSPSL